MILARRPLRTRQISAVAAVAVTAAGLLLASPAHAASGSGLRIGVLEADYNYFSSDNAAGIRVATVNLSWASWEPSPGVYSSSAQQAVVREVTAYESHGWAVNIDLGLQNPPSWVFSAAGSQLVDQNGNLSGTPNFEFSQTVRSAAAPYVANVVATLPGVSGYRIGLSQNGEAMYPNYGGNQWWAYSPQAQSGGSDLPAGVGVSPMPGWVPGSSTWAGATVTPAQVSGWYWWYLNASVNAHAWEMAALRAAGFAGQLQLVMPGTGILPQPMQQRIAADLAPGSYDSYDTMNVGAVWWQFLDNLPSLANTAIDISSVYDNSGSPRGNGCQAGDANVGYASSAIYSWSDTRWLTSLAERHNMATLGENPGNNTTADLQPMLSLAESCGLGTLQWAWDYSLNGSGAVSAAQLGAAATSANQQQSAAAQTVTAPSVAWTTTLSADNGAARLRLDVSGASTAPGARVITYPANGGANQSWQFVTHNATTYGIRSVNSGLCLTTDGRIGDQLTQQPCGYNAGQLWSTSLQPGTAAGETISNPWSGLVIDVSGNATGAGAAVIGWRPNGGANQLFGTTPASKPAAFTTTVVADNNPSAAHVLDVAGASVTSGTGVVEYDPTGGANQLWQFVATSGGYDLVNANSGLCLTTGSSLGAQVLQATCTGGANQVWSTALTPGVRTGSTIANPATGWYLNVGGNDMYPGGGIITWHQSTDTDELFSA